MFEKIRTGSDRRSDPQSHQYSGSDEHAEHLEPGANLTKRQAAQRTRDGK